MLKEIPAEELKPGDRLWSFCDLRIVGHISLTPPKDNSGRQRLPHTMCEWRGGPYVWVYGRNGKLIGKLEQGTKARIEVPDPEKV